MNYFEEFHFQYLISENRRFEQLSYIYRFLPMRYSLRCSMLNIRNIVFCWVIDHQINVPSFYVYNVKGFYTFCKVLWTVHHTDNLTI